MATPRLPDLEQPISVPGLLSEEGAAIVKIENKKTNPFESYLARINKWSESDPLLSETQLGKCLAKVPLNLVRLSDLVQLHQALNVEQLIPTENGLARDYRGLAELMEFSSVELEATFKRSHNPAKGLIEAYMAKQRHQAMSVNDLVKLIERLERFDVLDDFLPILIDVAHDFNGKELRHLPQSNNQQQALLPSPQNPNKPELQIAQQNRNQFGSPQTNQSFNQPGGHENETGALYKYDAFVCYAPEDDHFAEELIILLQRNNKCIATRNNLLPGHFEYDSLVHLIASQCRKLIIILTSNFLLSNECEFLTKFANEIAIKSEGFPKIVPVLFEPLADSKLPPLIRVISKIDMMSLEQSGKRFANREWQVEKLLRSLEAADRQTNLANGFHQQQPGRVSRVPSQRLDFGSFNLPSTNRSGFSPEPIIDLAHSQGSNSALNLVGCNPQQLHTASRISTPSPTSQTRPTPSTSSFQLNPLTWYKSVKRKMLAANRGEHSSSAFNSESASLAPSTSSRTRLLPEAGAGAYTSAAPVTGFDAESANEDRDSKPVRWQ